MEAVNYKKNHVFKELELRLLKTTFDCKQGKVNSANLNS